MINRSDDENDDGEAQKDDNHGFNIDKILVSQKEDENIESKKIESDEDCNENNSSEKDSDADNDDGNFDDHSSLTETIVSDMNDDFDSDRRQFQKRLSNVSKDIPEVINATERVFSNPIFMSMTKTPLKESNKNFGAPNQFQEEKKSINDAIGAQTLEGISSATRNSNLNASLDSEDINEKTSLLSQNIESLTNDQESNTQKDEILRPSIFTSMAEYNPNKSDDKESESERFVV